MPSLSLDPTMDAHTCKLARCAVYTRKSTEYNLDLAFNSLDAQREACEAYIKSQAHEGWRVIPHRYDDGAFSGASLERPALQELLSDIREGKIDIVLVYKVDRLTRSLADFAKLVELFERHSVSFVSVTQSFNTKSSMGRLTLNVLLSFAQFERELIGERVRDKIAASKRKGLWVGARSRSATRLQIRGSQWCRQRPRRCARFLSAIWNLARLERWLTISINAASVASRDSSPMAAAWAEAAWAWGRSPICSRTGSISARSYIGASSTALSMNRFSNQRCLRRCRASLRPTRWRGAAGCGARPPFWPGACLTVPAAA
jgi:DNA invertase Pin-like site-specific DNA recombinase